ncbi:hypothetical protein [Chryseobacterium sp.]|uniref:hypothetical protein n=1 Tax=Chryseobacterium sp. TaxID=1871047 RepID=UPI003219645A
MYKGRFGDYYIAKSWLFVVIISPCFYTLLFLYNDGSFEINDYIMFVIASIIYGFVVAIPSYLIIEILYRILSRMKLSNKNVFSIVSVLSLITTNISYYLFFGKNMFSKEAKIGGIPFMLIYSLFLMIGLLSFKKKLYSEKL